MDPHLDKITYHRNPTAREIRRGEGVIHYRDFPRYQCTRNGKLKRWFRALDDGLRYYH